VTERTLARPHHGGDPKNIPEANHGLAMLDLATGVNPWAWPVPEPPAQCYQVLPYTCPQLTLAAADYYGVASDAILATAGSQPVIQQLPYMVKPGRILLPAIAYEEHRYRWQQAGHDIYLFHDYQRECIAELIASEQIQHLLIISPNNPTGDTVSQADVRYWRSLLPDDGMVVLDQAFADVLPSSDLSMLAAEPGIVLLRSVGKFFGLPGLRLGFALGRADFLTELDDRLGPWGVSGSAQWLGRLALADEVWQQQMLTKLQTASQQQTGLLRQYFGAYIQHISTTPLFISLVMPLISAEKLQLACYAQGLSVRVYRGDKLAYMRWGLAADQNLLAQRLSGICFAGITELGAELGAGAAQTQRQPSNTAQGAIS